MSETGDDPHSTVRLKSDPTSGIVQRTPPSDGSPSRAWTRNWFIGKPLRSHWSIVPDIVLRRGVSFGHRKPYLERDSSSRKNWPPSGSSLPLRVGLGQCIKTGASPQSHSNGSSGDPFRINMCLHVRKYTPVKRFNLYLFVYSPPFLSDAVSGRGQQVSDRPWTGRPYQETGQV